MSLLYWTMLPWLWAAPLPNTTTHGSTLAPTPVPRPLLLLAALPVLGILALAPQLRRGRVADLAD